jgi:hypothetical protein
MTSRTTWLRLWLAFALAGVLAMPAGIMAQADTRIAGTVRDSSGSSVANAQVSVRNDKTGEVRQTTTNQQGAAGTFGRLTSTVGRTGNAN